HVNADDVEAVVQATTIALEYRQRFHRDVFIDLLGYRKYGHNEGDEPKFTQPKLYKAIANHPNPRDLYLKELIAQGVMTAEDGKKYAEEYSSNLDKSYEGSKKKEKADVLNFLEDTWKGYRHGTSADFEKEVITKVSKAKILELGTKLATLPEDNKYFRKIKKLLNDRLDQLKEDSLDWGMVEMLAYATLLVDGHPVRISGQDVERGTFSHRHAVFHDLLTGKEYIPLEKFSSQFTIINSVLSEEAVLAFEYGFALADPEGLVIWEAQFGDFANGAQVVIDQFISSGEQKWGRLCGLTMFLPHGFEGQGPEHSSARLERFLQLCAQDNMQVCVPTTPAQIFHLLRRQMIRPYRKPLIVMTPKSLLRHKLAVSTIDDLCKGNFMSIIHEDKVDPDSIDRIVLCSGKIYYELFEQRNKLDKKITILRIEQLYPFPRDELNDLIKKYSNAKEIVWCQEEPRNQGAWAYVCNYLMECLHSKQNLKYVGRNELAAPAEGSLNLHKHSQDKIIASALD
ncbi:MAG: 2-oxoglutarate dehydrogenase E1 component, partial [Legionellales bacterium]|nr:2-oxoglutarate dehydrogenase E1 component [Legionellales bacterium]